jgi:hypothetical protein
MGSESLEISASLDGVEELQRLMEALTAFYTADDAVKTGGHIALMSVIRDWWFAEGKTIFESLGRRAGEAWRPLTSVYQKMKHGGEINVLTGETRAAMEGGAGAWVRIVKGGMKIGASIKDKKWYSVDHLRTLASMTKEQQGGLDGEVQKGIDMFDRSLA